MKNPSKETQQDLETLFSKYQLIPTLREQFKEFVAENMSSSIDDDLIKMAPDALAQIYLHRQADVPTLVGILSPKFGTPQEVADKLLLLCEFDLIDFDMNTKRFMVKFGLSEDVEMMLARYQYPLPMIIHPEEVKDNKDTGYLTIHGSIVLNGSNFFDDKDLCLDHINKINSVGLSVDFDVVTSAEGKQITPVRNHGESFNDFNKRKRQADVFYQTSVEVMEGLFNYADELYLTYKYDRRGRCYASGYHVTTQGDDYRKAVLQLSKKEVITS